jgi:hypothetical protein
VTLRAVVGAAWALVLGLAGGWLVLAPWAVGGQGGGGWTTETRNEVLSGVGLVALALAALGILAAQAVSALREAGVLRQRPAGAQGGAEPATSPEMEAALVELATALAADLRSQSPGPPEEPAEPSWPRRT